MCYLMKKERIGFMDEEHVKSLVNECSVARLMGIEINEVREGRASGRLRLRKELLNMFGMPHGGVLFTFADQVCAACGNTLGRKAVAVESTIHFMKSAPGEEILYAEAEVTFTSRSIGRMDARIFTAGGDTVARMHQLFFIKNEAHDKETPGNL
jgi:acyl-CoA thioesterase